jgi:transcriptional regulator with XRE-family HTH domain
MDTDPKAQLGYRLYWKRIAMHLNLKDIAEELGTRSVELSKFEKGDFSKLTPEQLIAYLNILEMSDKAPDYLALMQATEPVAETGQ